MLVYLFTGWFFARTSLGTWDISCCLHSFLSSLSFHQLLYLFHFQTITDCYFAIALPLLMPLSHDFS